MKKKIILSIILLSGFILTSCGTKAKTTSDVETQVKTSTTLNSFKEEPVVQIPIPEEIMKISQDNTGSKEFIAMDQLKVIKETLDTGEENIVKLLNNSTTEKINATLAEDGTLIKYVYKGNNILLPQFLLSIDDPSILNEIQGYLAEEAFEKHYASEKFNYEISHNRSRENTNEQTIITVTRI